MEQKIDFGRVYLSARQFLKFFNFFISIRKAFVTGGNEVLN